MSLILYIETNFILGIATGRDSLGESLLKDLPKQINLFMPSVCYLELLVALENEKKRNKQFIESVKIEINEANRKIKLPNSKNVVNILKQSSLSYEQLFNDFESRLIDTVSLLEKHVQWINPQAGDLKKTLTEPILTKEKEMRDNLILQSILTHAQNIKTNKVFLSSNSKQFNQTSVQMEFKAVNLKYFTSTDRLLNWFDLPKDDSIN